MPSSFISFELISCAYIGLSSQVESSDPTINEGYFVTCNGSQIEIFNNILENMPGAISVLLWFRPKSGLGGTVQTLMAFQNSTSSTWNLAIEYISTSSIIRIRQQGSVPLSISSPAQSIEKGILNSIMSETITEIN